MEHRPECVFLCLHITRCGFLERSFFFYCSIWPNKSLTDFLNVSWLHCESAPLENIILQDLWHISPGKIRIRTWNPKYFVASGLTTDNCKDKEGTWSGRRKTTGLVHCVIPEHPIHPWKTGVRIFLLVSYSAPEARRTTSTHLSHLWCQSTVSSFFAYSLVASPNTCEEHFSLHLPQRAPAGTNRWAPCWIP